MPVCLKPVALAVDGATVHALVVDPTISDLSTCAYVAQSGAELANSLFSLTAAEGAYLSGLVIACWMAAYGTRVVINVIKGSME